MRIKNLEKAFDERMIEINNIYALQGMDDLTYEKEKLYAEVALNQLKKDRNYEIWNKVFENRDINGYLHDKDLYSSVVSFVRNINISIKKIADNRGISPEEVIDVVKTRFSKNP